MARGAAHVVKQAIKQGAQTAQEVGEKAAKKAVNGGFRSVINSNTTLGQIGGMLDDLTGLGSGYKSLTSGSASKVLKESGVAAGLKQAGKDAGYYTTKMIKNEGEGVATEVIDKLNVGKIAGAYMGVSAATRVLTGGGLYRDQNGNANLPGIPFI